MAEGILAVVLDVAEGQTVQRVQLRVGKLHLVVPDSLRFCFELAAQETPAAGARLEMAEVPARVRCHECWAESETGAPPFHCGACGTFDVELVAGEELLVDAVELEDGWRRRPDAGEAGPAMTEFAQQHLREHAIAAEAVE